MKKIFLAVGLVLMLLLASCSKPATKMGTISGRLSIGPLCPVETIPPDPGCQATAETFKAWPLVVYSSGRERVRRIIADENGSFVVDIPPGRYTIEPEQKTSLGKTLPIEFTIKAGETTEVNVDIDTGIR